MGASPPTRDVESDPTTAAATLSLSGRYAVQARQVRAGLEVWASDEGVELRLVDDRGVVPMAQAAYRGFVAEGIELLVGPYGSDMVRGVAPAVCRAGRLLWNHGGAADDLAQPLLATVVAPASTYLHDALAVVRRTGLAEVQVAHGRGPFARAVATGAEAQAAALGLPIRRRGLSGWQPERSLARVAVFFVSTFHEEVEAVAVLRRSGAPVGMIGCVAAGIEAFGARLGDRAEGIVGPAQWLPTEAHAEVGPSAAEFTRRFEQLAGRTADYPAAQAATAGYLACEAARRGYGSREVHRWHTSTLLGPFALDQRWRQIGLSPVTVQWRDGRRVRLT